MSAAGRRLLADAEWYRSESTRLHQELTAASPAQLERYGDAVVRRMRVDAETFGDLADEHEAYLVTHYPELVPHLAGPVVEDAPLF